jgi:outer membrane protein TolC
MRQMAEADVRSMAADTRAKVADLYATIERARRLSELYRFTVLPQASATVTSSLASYRVGGVDFMTLVDNAMTVNRYRQELITLRAEEGKAIAELEMLVGRVLTEEPTR